MTAPVSVRFQHRTGDVFQFPADVLVNPWNRNFVPRWLLNPGGVSGELKKRTGPEPWRELASHGLLGIGQAVITEPGLYDGARSLVHVAGLTALWRATSQSVYLSARNAVHAATSIGARTLTMPLIGAGHGGLTREESREQIALALRRFPTRGRITLTVTVVETPIEGTN